MANHLAGPKSSPTPLLSGRGSFRSDSGLRDGRRRSTDSSSAGSVGSASSGVIVSPRTRALQHWQQQNEPRGDSLRKPRDVDDNFVKELASQLRWRYRNLLALTQTFLPALVTDALKQCAVFKTDLELPLMQNHSGCVAKVNCSGFVELTARWERHQNGASMLSKCINRFYTHVIDIIMAYRGDVVRFNANTMIVFFEAVDDSSSFNSACGTLSCKHAPQELACIRAAACCLDLHKHLCPVDAGKGDVHLTLRVGVGAGTIKVLVVRGSPSKESCTSNKYTVTGPALEQATRAERLAEPRETVFSSQAWLHVAQTAREGAPLKQQPDFHRFLAFNTRLHTYPMVRHAALQSQTASSVLVPSSHPRSAAVRRCLHLLMDFLPDSVLRHVCAGTLSNVNELRTLTVAFVYLKGLDPSMHDGAHTVAGVVSALQRAAFAEEGYLHRFLVDEHGLLLQFAFGLPPLVHTDDPVRACRACSRILRIASRSHLVGHVGVATGRVFCGLVGSERRHEYGIVGNTVQLAVCLSNAAEASTVLVDQATRRSCEVELDFREAEPVIVAGSAEACLPAFQLVSLCGGHEPATLPAVHADSGQRPPLGSLESQPAEPRGNVDSTPCTPPSMHPPPWLADLEREEGQPRVQWEQPFPNLWAHVCAERPPPPLTAPQDPASCEAFPLTGSGGDAKPWRTFIKVPLPWPARSTVCGGVSPLPSLRCWRHLVEAERVVDRCVEKGGGLVILAGPFGCGKTELTEHLVTRSVQGSSRMQPVFGAMEGRFGQRWAALRGVLHGALSLLQPAGCIHSSRELGELLVREAASSTEQRALEVAGLVGRRKPAPLLELVGSPDGREEDSLDPARGFTAATEVLSDTEDQTSDSGDDSKSGEVLVAMVVRLLERLLQWGSVVVALRISQGTSLLAMDTTDFWRLARALGELASRHNADLSKHHHSLLVLVTCRKQHMDVDTEARHPVVHLGPLSGHEVQRYIHLCLGLAEECSDSEVALGLEDSTSPRGLALALLDPSTTERSTEPESPSTSTREGGGGVVVPQTLVQWLRRIADLPRHLEEGLTELHRARVITVASGRCALLADMNVLNTADWIHTHMVGRIISQMEVMVPEMQHVLQIATVLPGAFSSLDLAAAIRVHLAWDTPNMMALYHCVKRLMACEELVRAGYLRRVDLKRPKDGAAAELADYCRREDVGAPSCMPRWAVASVLIHQVVGSTVLQGTRLQLKRAILLGRAMERLRWARGAGLRQRGRRTSEASLSSEVERSAQCLSRPLGLRRGAAALEVGGSAAASKAAAASAAAASRLPGLPSSCVVTSTSLHELPRQTTQATTRDTTVPDSEDPLDAAPQRSESRFKFSSRNVLYMLPPLALRLPRKLLQQGLVFAIIVVILLWPDLWIILEGDQGSLDVVMLIAMCFFAFDVVLRLLADKAYNCRSLLTDLVVLVSILLDVSWAMGKPQTDLAITRKSAASVWRIIGVYIKFGACAVRLTLFIRYVASLLHSSYERRLKHRISHVEPEGSSRLLEDISRKLAQAILLHLVTFTILIILSLQVVDVFTPPKEDASMQTWVQLLTQKLATNNGSGVSQAADPVASSGSALEGELQRFQQFYSDRAYGPYSICLGANTMTTFKCEEVLWESLEGSSFVDPMRQAFQMNVHSSSVQASFDFSQPAKQEALIRLMIISTTVLCMVIVAISLDSVANGLVVSPLARLLPTVRQVMTQLQEKFPTLEQQDDGEEHDEVTAFEEMVSKITLVVTSANKHKFEGEGTEAGSEWINGIATAKDGKKEGLKVLHQVSGVTSEVAMNDILRLQQLGVSYESVDSWSYDVLALEKPQLTGVTGWLLLDFANPYLAVDPHVVAAFLDAMVQHYRDENPYHNWMHACDVQHGVFRSCMLNRVLDFASRVDVFALLVAAVSHDAGHPGLNNQFLVQTSHELALRYNDVSPLENMHCSTMFGVLSSRPDANVFGVLNREQYREARQVCIETILHTDNAKHFEMVKELQMFYHTNSDIFDRHVGFPSVAETELLRQAGNRRLALTALLHGADISNPCKPWTICESWADLVLSEFFLQGDREKELGIPVQMLNNRDTVNKPSSQVAFIEFFIYPFNTALVKVFSPLWEMSDNLHTNLQRWQAMRTTEEQEKTGPKVQAICEDLLHVIQAAWGQMKKPSKTPAALRSRESVSDGLQPKDSERRAAAEHPQRTARASTWFPEPRCHSASVGRAATTEDPGSRPKSTENVAASGRAPTRRQGSSNSLEWASPEGPQAEADEANASAVSLPHVVPVGDLDSDASV